MICRGQTFQWRASGHLLAYFQHNSLEETVAWHPIQWHYPDTKLINLLIIKYWLKQENRRISTFTILVCCHHYYSPSFCANTLTPIIELEQRKIMQEESRFLSRHVKRFNLTGNIIWPYLHWRYPGISCCN